MERTGLTMALLQILLLLLYALPSFSLPITSSPLTFDDTPENIAYALSLESPPGEGVRKIPKSIFIFPSQPDFHTACQNGFKMKDGKCVKIQNFEVNHLALITAQLEQFLDKTPTTVDYDEYDYDNYGDVTESAEPFHVPLSVSFDDDDLPVRDKYNDQIQNMPFLADDFDSSSEETSKKSPTSTAPKSTERENVVPNVATVATNVDKWTDDNLANNKDSTRAEQDINPTTSSNVAFTTPEEESLLLFSDLHQSTTQKKVLVDEPDTLAAQEGLDPTTVNGDGTGDSVGIAGSKIDSEAQRLDQDTAGNHMVHNHIELTTQSEDQNNFDKELQSESLFKDDSSTGTSINVSDGTTEMYENDMEATTQPLNSLSDKEVNNAISVSTPVEPPLEPSSKIENPVVVVPTVEQVQIVTPVQQTTTSHSTSHHRKKPNSQSTPSSTYTSELQTAERLNINESMMNKKLIESAMKHELNEDAIETIDTNNRFVYTHLDSSSNEPVPPSSSSSTSTTMQSTITQQSPLEQLRFLNEDSRRNNRIRFPEQPSPVNIFSNFKGGTIKFPGPVQQRPAEPLFNRLIPDIIPKKPPESSGDRPLFSWLPAGTSFDFNRNSSPAFMRFWNKMPLIRDRSITSNASSEQPRANSKSPTDNLYKDAPPASEVYKVISSRNYKHDNR